eukprot:6713630-Pyramimonas_sp.AAC.1
MDRGCKLEVDWLSVKDRHCRLLQRVAKPDAARGFDSSGRPPPWTAAGKEAARASRPDQWT